MDNSRNDDLDPNTVDTRRIAQTTQYVLDSTVGKISQATGNESLGNAVEYANTTVRGALGGTERPESNASEDSKTNVDEISDEQVEDFLRNQYRSVKRSAG